ncbi:hypothetical protein GC173_11175 [bacterium]|nr:hypothetical protein [bacterium]
MTRERGIIITAAGAESLRETRELLRSLRRHHPELPVVVHTDVEVESDFPAEIVIIPAERRAARNYNRIVAWLETPFERTLGLDSDLWVMGRLDELFDCLDRYDYACKLAPERDSYRNFRDPNSRNSADAPDIFPERSMGLFAYRRTPVMMQLLEAWRAGYAASFLKRNGHPIDQATTADRQRDQPPFRNAVYKSDARELIIGEEWNTPLAQPCLIRTMSRVLHCHLRDLEPGTLLPGCRTWEEAEREVNQSHHFRFIWPGYGVYTVPPKWPRLLRLGRMVARDAVGRLLAKTLGR